MPISLYKKFLLILVFFSFLPFIVLANDEALPNTGLIKSGIWYSKDPFYAGDKVRIYTIIFNGSSSDLLGGVRFEDNGRSICEGNFNAVAGRTQELWCDWTASVGSHKIVAKIVNAKIAPIGETPVAVSLENDISGVSERNVTTPPIEKKLIVPKSGEVFGEVSTTSESLVEQKIKDGLSAVKENVSDIAPKGVSVEGLDRTKDKILSYLPAPIKNGIDKVVEFTGLSRLKEPLSYLVDFFAAMYKFIINDPLLLVILLSFVVWEILRYFFKRSKRNY